MRLLLASKSPRRRELVALLGMDYSFVDIDADEHLNAAVPPHRVAESIACHKADAFDMGALQVGDVLVTADTVVALDGEVLGKPAGHDEAVGMLRRLSGRMHTVYTGVCLCSRQGRRSFTEATNVYFNTLDERDIAYYVDRYRPYDKAGAYGIQEWIGMVGVGRIEGCYYNVVGLPVPRLYSELMALVR